MDLTTLATDAGDLSALAEGIATGELEPVLFVDDFDRREVHLPNEFNQAAVIDGALAVMVRRKELRVVAAGGFAMLSGGGLAAGLTYTRRNFLVLQPPQEISEGVFSAHYRTYVPARVGREYGPGEGVLISQAGSSDVVVAPEQSVIHALDRVSGGEKVAY